MLTEEKLKQIISDFSSKRPEGNLITVGFCHELAERIRQEEEKEKTLFCDNCCNLSIGIQKICKHQVDKWIPSKGKYECEAKCSLCGQEIEAEFRIGNIDSRCCEYVIIRLGFGKTKSVVIYFMDYTSSILIDKKYRLMRSYDERLKLSKVLNESEDFCVFARD